MKEGEIAERFSGNRLRSLSDGELAQMGLRSNRPLAPPAINHQLIIRSPAGPKARTQTSDVGPKDLYIESLEMNYTKASQPLLRIRDYCFKANRIHALVGCNGMGKSTFLRSLAGLEKRAKGHVRYAGKRYQLKQMHRLCSVVFQDVNRQLLTHSVYHELLLSIEGSGRQAKEILSLAQKLELDHFLEAHPFALSGGQKQRLAFATALLMDRPVLILDEPTSGLDLKHMVAMAEILAEHAQDHLIFLATHDQELLQLLNAEIHELINPSSIA